MKNRKLTDNFSLYEFIESSLPKQAVDLNWQHIDQFSVNLHTWESLAVELQKIRNIINLEYRQGNGGREIALKLTSAFRCKEWELIRGRTGSSQHCVGVAADIQPLNCSNSLAVEIMQWLYSRHHSRHNGWNGGFAIKQPTYTQGGIIEKIGFLHYDLRGYPARWEYL